MWGQALHQDATAFQAETGRMNAQIIPAHSFGQCQKGISFETATQIETFSGQINSPGYWVHATLVAECDGGRQAYAQ